MGLSIQEIELLIKALQHVTFSEIRDCGLNINAVEDLERRMKHAVPGYY